MTNPVAEEYIALMGEGEKPKLALLACSSALRLDDEIARQAIELVVQSNGSTDDLLRRVKSLSCVWEQWDGAWYIAEDVRPHLSERLYEEVSEATLFQLRDCLATYAHKRASGFSPDGQVTAYRMRQAKFEAAYQQMLIPEQTHAGAKQLTDLWRASPKPAAEATAESVDYLAPELDRHLQHLPDQVLFLQGMAAHARRDKPAQIKYFRAVWKNGRYGDIYAIAAHLFGLLIRDRRTAEHAFRDSIRWNDSRHHQAEVWHSLGNLLANNKNRWHEAEEAYHESLELRHDPEHQGQALHSLGNLLAKDKNRWKEAEVAYHKSLELLHDPEDKAKVWHSLGNLLTKDKDRWEEAEEAYNKSLELRHDPIDKAHTLASWANLLSKFKTAEGYERAEKFALDSLKLDPNNSWTNGVCYRVLADVYEFQGEFGKAIEMLEALMRTDRQLGKTKFEQKILGRISSLSQRR